MHLPEQVISPADRIISSFTEKLREVDSIHITGIYLIGSITQDDFIVDKSDIDFLVFCTELPDQATAEKLHQLHRIVERIYPGPGLSGVYVPAKVISAERIQEIRVLNFHQGKISYGKFDMAPVCLWEVHTNAVVLYQKDYGNLPFTVDSSILTKFLHNNINRYWKSWVNVGLRSLYRQFLIFCFPRLTEWVLLGIARQLYTLETGQICSKTAAGQYALSRLPAKFHPIINAAIKARSNKRIIPFFGSYSFNLSIHRLTETIKCARYMIHLFNEKYEQIEKD